MTGIEWLIETFGCTEARLRDLRVLTELFDRIVSSMSLRPVGAPVWHAFPGDGGVTGIWLLQESHLAIHTFPEYASACLNVFCCTARPAVQWDNILVTHLGAKQTRIRECRRSYGSAD